MPGRRRNARAPSSTIRMLYGTDGTASCPKNDDSVCAVRRRSVTRIASSVMRWAADSVSAPTRATQSSPSRGAQCGSQRTQFHSSPACWSAERTTMARSRGLCRTAACATIHRASAREAYRGPVSPTTPSGRRRVET